MAKENWILVALRKVSPLFFSFLFFPAQLLSRARTLCSFLSGFLGISFLLSLPFSVDIISSICHRLSTHFSLLSYIHIISHGYFLSSCIECLGCGAKTPGPSTDSKWSHGHTLCMSCAHAARTCLVCSLACAFSDSSVVRCRTCRRFMHGSVRCLIVFCPNHVSLSLLVLVLFLWMSDALLFCIAFLFMNLSQLIVTDKKKLFFFSAFSGIILILLSLAYLFLCPHFHILLVFVLVRRAFS